MATLPGEKSQSAAQQLDDLSNMDTDAPFHPPIPSNVVSDKEPEPEPIQELNRVPEAGQPLVELNRPVVPQEAEPVAVEGRQPDIRLTKRPPNVVQLGVLKQKAQARLDRKEQFQDLKRKAVFSQEADVRGGIAEGVSDILLDPISDIAAIALNLLLDPASAFQEGSNGQNLGREIQHGLNGVYKLFGMEPLTAEETGLDKGIPTDGFSTLFKQPIFPGTSPESFFDLTPLIPPAEAEFGNVGTQERSRKFLESKEIAIATIFGPLTRLLRRLKKIAPGDTRKFAKVKEFLRKQGEAQSDFGGKLPVPGLTQPGGFPQVRLPVDKASLRSAAIDVTGGIAFAKGVTLAQEKGKGAFYEMAFGTANAAFFTGLSLRLLYTSMAQLQKLGSMRVGTAGAKKRAKKLLHETVGDEREKIAENLDSNGLDKDGNPVFLPGFFAALGPDLKTQNQQAINLFTAFIEENADLKTTRSALHQKLSDMMMEMVRTRADSTELTEETIKQALQALDDIIQKRIAISLEGVANDVATVTTHLTQDEAHRMGLKAIMREQELANNTEHTLWNGLHLRDIEVAPVTGMKRWEEILRETGAEEGSGLLNLASGEGKKDLYKFLGKLQEEKGSFNVVLGKWNPSTKVFKPGQWGSRKTVSMQDVQNMRSRVLRAIREERVSDVPNERRIAKLEQVEDALLKTQESLTTAQLAKTPGLLQAYQAAREATHIVKKRFGTGEIYEILRIRKGGEARAEEVGLEAIFRGAGATKGKAGDLAIKEILRDVHGGPIKKGEPLTGAALEVAQSMEELFKMRFKYHAMRDGEIVPRKAKDFVKARSEALKNFPQLKEDFDQAIRTNDASILEVKRYENVLKDIKNENISLATLYSTKGPKTTFDKYIKDPDRSEKEMMAEIADLMRLADMEPTGKARKGLNGSLMLWIINKATYAQRNNLEMPEMIAGSTIKNVWESKPIQVATKMLFDKEEQQFMQQLLESSALLDKGVLSHAGKAGSADLKPDRMIENIFRVMILDKFPLARGGGGSIAKQTIISKSARDLLHKYYKNPAHAMVIEAFLSKDKELLRELFSDIITEEDAARAAIVFNTWFQSALLNAGVREVREEQQE